MGKFVSPTLLRLFRVDAGTICCAEPSAESQVSPATPRSTRRQSSSLTLPFVNQKQKWPAVVLWFIAKPIIFLSHLYSPCLLLFAWASCGCLRFRQCSSAHRHLQMRKC